MLQTLLTALIVAAATLAAVWRFAPARWRQGAARRTASLAHATLSEPMARRIEIRAVQAAAKSGSCGDCGPCDACSPHKQPAGGAPPSACH